MREMWRSGDRERDRGHIRRLPVNGEQMLCNSGDIACI